MWNLLKKIEHKMSQMAQKSSFFFKKKRDFVMALSNRKCTNWPKINRNNDKFLVLSSAQFNILTAKSFHYL